MTNFLEELPPNIREIAERGNIQSAEDILNVPKSKFLQIGAASKVVIENCTEHDVRVLKAAAAKLVAQRPVTVSTLLQPPLLKWARISFGCKALDHCTGGGIVARGITEICGASGAGKTQLLLQLSLSVQLPVSMGGLSKGVAFICTENAFPSKRLFEMSKSFGARFPGEDINFLGNIYIEHVIESEDLLNCVSVRLAKLMKTINIGLIIIDSVAAIFRVYTDFIERARDMRKLANSLLNYANKFQCAVVCVNQVATISETEPDVPCLGLSWAHLGRTRIRISKVPKQLMVNDQLVMVRKLEIMYSPETPNEFAEFLITAQGIVDVP